MQNKPWFLPYILVVVLVMAAAPACYSIVDMEKILKNHDPLSNSEGASTVGALKDTIASLAQIVGLEISDKFPVAGTVAVGNSVLRLRLWPWGDVLSTFSSDTPVTVLGVSGEFYLVEVNGQQGFMHKNYIGIPGAPASGVEPYYPGDTLSGGSLSLAAGVKASKDGAAGKVPTTTTPSSSGTPSKPSVGSGGKVVISVPQKCQMQVRCPAPGSACGPTSLAMILAYYKKGNVDALATDLWSVCGSTASSGTGHEGLKRGAAKYGFPNAKWHFCVSQSWVRTQIKAGKPILAHVKGHYVVIKGIDDSGRIYFNDPGRSVVDRSMSFSEFSSWWCGAGSTHPCMVLE